MTINKKYLAITVLIMIFIFVQSALPGHVSGAESNFIVRIIVGMFGTDAEATAFAVRKLAHFTEYMMLGASMMMTIRDKAKYSRNSSAAEQIAERNGIRTCLTAWLIGAAYAATDEFHQSFVPGRSCELRDVMIDAAGVAAGVIAAGILLKNAAGKQDIHTEEARS